MSSRFGFFGRNITGAVESNAIVAQFSLSQTIANANSVIFSISSNLTSEPRLLYRITGVNSTAFIDDIVEDTIDLDANGNATLIKTLNPASISQNGDFYLEIKRADAQETFLTSANVTILTVTDKTVISGGTQSTKGSNITITVSSNTTLSVTKASDPWLSTDATPIYLEMIGGGGGGSEGGGGGATLLTTVLLANAISAGNANAIIGSGGLGGLLPKDGTNSSLFGQTALGGYKDNSGWRTGTTNNSSVYGGKGGESFTKNVSPFTTPYTILGAEPVFEVLSGGVPIPAPSDGSFIVTGGTGAAGNVSSMSGRSYGGGGGGGAYILLAPDDVDDLPWATYRGNASHGGGIGGTNATAGTGGGGGGGFANPSLNPVTLTYGNGGSGSIYIELPSAAQYNVLKP